MSFLPSGHCHQTLFKGLIVRNKAKGIIYILCLIYNQISKMGIFMGIFIKENNFHYLFMKNVFATFIQHSYQTKRGHAFPTTNLFV